MKAIEAIFLLSIIFSTTYAATTVYSWYYNYEYEIFNNNGGSSYLEPAVYYGKIQVHSDDLMDLRFKVYKNAQITFVVSAALFDHDPSDIEVKASTVTWIGMPMVVDRDSLTDYDIYKLQSPFNTLGYFYLAIRFETKQSLHYLSFFAYSGKYNYIKDLEYNTYYYADMSYFPTKKLPEEYHYYIRIPVHSDDKMEIRLEVRKTPITRLFDVDVCQYKYWPTTANVYGDYIPIDNVCYIKITPSYDHDSSYDKYIYEFTTGEGITYLAIHIASYNNGLDYLSFYIYSETGMAIGIIVLIVVLCIVVLGGGAGAGYRAYRKRTI